MTQTNESLSVVGPLTLELRVTDSRTEIVRCEIGPDVMQELPFAHGGFEIVRGDAVRASLYPTWLCVNRDETYLSPYGLMDTAPCLSAVRALNDRVMAKRGRPLDNDHFTEPEFVCASIAPPAETDGDFALRMLRYLVTAVAVRKDGKHQAMLVTNAELSKPDALRLAQLIGGNP